MTQARYVYHALYYYCIGIYDETTIQLTITQNQWEPFHCHSLIGV